MINRRDLISTFIEVELPDEDTFLKVKETLTRIGISSNSEKKLWQSCHILHKKGKYYITHFKEMFGLDGLADALNDDDLGRRNTIAKLLHDWGLCTIVGSKLVGEDQETGKKLYTFPDNMKLFCPLNKIKILTHRDKFDWQLLSKYPIGKRFE
jgi:hypothetical protein